MKVINFRKNLKELSILLEEIFGRIRDSNFDCKSIRTDEVLFQDVHRTRNNFNGSEKNQKTFWI